MWKRWAYCLTFMFTIFSQIKTITTASLNFEFTKINIEINVVAVNSKCVCVLCLYFMDSKLRHDSRWILKFCSRCKMCLLFCVDAWRENFRLMSFTSEEWWFSHKTMLNIVCKLRKLIFHSNVLFTKKNFFWSSDIILLLAYSIASYRYAHRPQIFNKLMKVTN